MIANLTNGDVYDQKIDTLEECNHLAHAENWKHWSISQGAMNSGHWKDDSDKHVQEPPQYYSLAACCRNGPSAQINQLYATILSQGVKET